MRIFVFSDSMEMTGDLVAFGSSLAASDAIVAMIPLDFSFAVPSDAKHSPLLSTQRNPEIFGC